MTKCCTHYHDGPCEELVEKFHKMWCSNLEVGWYLCRSVWYIDGKKYCNEKKYVTTSIYHYWTKQGEVLYFNCGNRFGMISGCQNGS